jgi:hypothetical protein
MPSKVKNRKGNLGEQVSRSDPMPAPLPMPTYEYQTPASGTFVLRYDEQKERQKQAAQEKAPVLQNLKFAAVI